MKTPLGGVPPPLVFDFGRFVAWKDVLKNCVVKLGFLVKSQVMRWVSSGSGRSWAAPEQVLGTSWAGPELLLGILVGFWEALGLSWAAPGLLLGCLGHSWAVLGGSWPFLGDYWAALGHSWAALERSWPPSWSQDGAQEAQSRPQDPQKSRPRRSKIALICKTIFRSPFWEHPESFERPFCQMLDRLGAQK